MLTNTNKEKGRAGLSLAIAYFGSNGYTVSLPINDTQWYDLIVEKDGIFQTVQCRCTGSKDNVISLRSCGGTHGASYDNVLNHPLDLLFCADAHKNMYVIPVEHLRKHKNRSMITLRNSAGVTQGFDTYPYKVNL